tara:strand:- start:16568 stop:17371 length:804 start_codon:yes stop_codon:yes gene_type:complete
LTKISIITPVLNGEKTIEKTIKSVLYQNYSNLEYIIVDGLSTDRTHEVIERYKKYISKVIIEKDQNLYDAMNKGIQSSQGDLIGIINADDYYNEGALKTVLKSYEQSLKKDIIIYGDMFNEYKQTKVLSRGNLSNAAFKSGKFQICHPTVFVSKTLYDRIGLFNINFNSGADREFILRAHKNKANFLKVNKSLATFRLGGFTSSYSLNLIFNRSKEEFKLLIKYYPKWYAFKKSLEQFYRMLRNFCYYHLFGHNKFLKARIKKLNKK